MVKVQLQKTFKISNWCIFRKNSQTEQEFSEVQLTPNQTSFHIFSENFFSIRKKIWNTNISFPTIQGSQTSPYNMASQKGLVIAKIPSTYSRGSCTPPSWPHAEYPLKRRFPFTGSTAKALLNQSAVWPKAYLKLFKQLVTKIIIA